MLASCAFPAFVAGPGRPPCRLQTTLYKRLPLPPFPPSRLAGQLAGAGSSGPGTFSSSLHHAASGEKQYSFASGFSLFGGAGAGGKGGAAGALGAAGGAEAPRPGSAGGGAAGAGAAEAAGVGASALDALRHSRFGSLLGDKAAEVSAMASGVSQTLGEYSFSTTLSGALGAGAGGLLSSFGLPSTLGKSERR
jgi:hypothetical protein